MHIDTLNLEHIKVILDHSKFARNSKAAHCRMKWTEIPHLGNKSSSPMGTILPCTCRGYFGISLCTLPCKMHHCALCDMCTLKI